MFNLDPWYMLVAMVVSAIGMGAFMYGKKMGDGKFLMVGGALFVVTYFITDPIWLSLVSLLLCVVLFSNPIQKLLAGSSPPVEIEEVPPRKKR